MACPLCWRLKSEERKLADNGGYGRNIPTAPGECERGWIYRKFCSGCKVSFSLHPEFLVRGQQYALALVAAWLWAWLGGISSQSREFYERHGIRCPVSEEPPDGPQTCWSDLLRQSGTRPGIPLLCRWGRRFARWAALHKEALARPLRDEGVWESARRAAARRFRRSGLPTVARPLALAWIYREAVLRRESSTGEVAGEEDFRRLVGFLGVRGEGASHAVRRAFAGRVNYGGLIIDGRGAGALPG